MRHIEITDLPSDTNGTLSGVRRELLMAYNGARGNETKLRLLNATINYIKANLNQALAPFNTKETK